MTTEEIIEILLLAGIPFLLGALILVPCAIYGVRRARRIEREESDLRKSYKNYLDRH